MGNPLPSIQSFNRQQPSTGLKWDSGLGKAKPSRMFGKHLGRKENARSMSGELTRPKPLFSGEFPAARTVRSSKGSFSSNDGMRDAAINSDSSFGAATVRELLHSSVRPKSLGENEETKDFETTELINVQEPEGGSCDVQHFTATSDISSSADVCTASTQPEKEGCHSRLLSRGSESSGLRGRQLSSSWRRESLSFRKEPVSSSFRKDLGSRRRERKATKSFQDGELSSLASDSFRGSTKGSPCSIHYNQAPFSVRATTPAPPNMLWSSTPSSPDRCSEKLYIPFQWEEAPGRAKTIAAAAEMALARKLARDESLRRINAASPRSSVDGRVSFRLEVVSEVPHPVLPLPPSKKFSQEFAKPREDLSLQLNDELKAVVKVKETEDDTKSVLSDYGAGEQAHIDLVAPAAAKIFNRENEKPDSTTPIKSLVAVPFKWEEAPGKPKDYVAPPDPEPTLLSLPPRLLGGCHNPSKEQKAKIFHSYSCNVADMYGPASGNSSPLSRSIDNSLGRRPNVRDRVLMKGDETPDRGDFTSPGRSFPTPTRNYLTRVVPKSGPVRFPTLHSQENVRDHYSGPLRSNTHSNYLNASPRSLSHELTRKTHESALMVLTQDLEHSNVAIADCEEIQVVGRSSPEIARRRIPFGRGTCSLHSREQLVQDSLAVVKVVPNVPTDPLSPTSILCGPDTSSQRSTLDHSSVCGESSRSNGQQAFSSHSKSDSLESFVDEAHYLPPVWSDSDAVEASPYRDMVDLGPRDNHAESSQGFQHSKTVARFVRKVRMWKKRKNFLGMNSAGPELRTPSLASYFPKLDFGKVSSQVFPESKDVRIIHLSGHLSAPCSPMNFISRSVDASDRLGARKPLGSMTPVHVISTSRAPAFRVMAADDCFSAITLGKVWNGSKAHHARWRMKLRKSSRVMVSAFGSLKRSLKCGRHGLSKMSTDSNLLDFDFDTRRSL